MAARRRKTYGFSFSLNRALGITAAKQRFARKTGIPTTRGGWERKVGRMMLGGGGRRRRSSASDDVGAIALILLIVAIPIWIVRAVLAIVTLGSLSTSSQQVTTNATPRRKTSLASVAVLILLCVTVYYAFKAALHSPYETAATPLPSASAPIAQSVVAIPESSTAPVDAEPAVQEAPAVVRTWVDSTGRYHREAELADFQHGHAYLKETNGRIVSVPLERLSHVDRAFIASTVPEPRVLIGNVTGVTDGDTLNFHDNEHGFFRIRLDGIDAPERDQPFGAEAKDALTAAVLDKEVVIESHGVDSHGRTLGHIFCDGHWINDELVNQGLAWHYRRFSKSPVLEASEAAAREKRIGLWKGNQPVAPWDHRDPLGAEQQVTLDELHVPHTAPSTPSVSAEAKDYVDHVSTVATPSPQQRSHASSSTSETHDSHSDGVTGHTATGIPIHTGPRGGHFHYSISGKKVYERKHK